MGVKSFLLSCSLTLGICWGGVSLGDEPCHTAVTPTARPGGPMNRHVLINSRVQEMAGKSNLIFVGDSITQGWEGAGKEVWVRYYGHRGALNLGIGGDRTQHVLWRLSHGNLEGVFPKLAVVMIGTNNSGDDRNSAEEIVDGVQAVVKSLRAKRPEMKVLLLAIFPRGERFNAQRGKILQVNQTIERMADGEMIFYKDIGSLFLNDEGELPKDIMPDFLHLSPKGYTIWAEAIEPMVSRLLGESMVPPAGSLSLDGKWIFRIMGPNNEPVEAPMEIRLIGNRMEGTFAMGPGRVLEIEQGEWKSPVFSFQVRRNRPDGSTMTYRMSGTVHEGGTIEGKVKADVDGETVESEWSARRTP